MTFIELDQIWYNPVPFADDLCRKSDHGPFESLPEADRFAQSHLHYNAHVQTREGKYYLTLYYGHTRTESIQDTI